MKSHSRIAVIRQSSIVFLALLLVPTSLLFAQTNRGGISGTVFDQQGAVVPGATVTIINVGTNQRIVATTSASGSYGVSNLEPVTYRIEVQAAGFRRAYNCRSTTRSK